MSSLPRSIMSAMSWPRILLIPSTVFLAFTPIVAIGGPVSCDLAYFEKTAPYASASGPHCVYERPPVSQRSFAPIDCLPNHRLECYSTMKISHGCETCASFHTLHLMGTSSYFYILAYHRQTRLQTQNPSRC